jgi:signal transduction histidine kinase
MDKLKKHQLDLTLYSLFWIATCGLLSVGSFLAIDNVFGANRAITLLATVPICFLLSYFASRLLVLASTQPLKAIWQAILHVTPVNDASIIPAPITDNLTHGRDLSNMLIERIYSMSSNNTVQAAAAPALANPSLLIDLIPLPVVVLDGNDNIVKANKLFGDYAGLVSSDLTGQSFTNSLPIQLQGDAKIQEWFDSVKHTTVTASASWNRVSLQLPDEKGIKQFDMIGHYSKDNPAGFETLLAIFDHTDRYSDEDLSTSYVALAVHELRTPLTVLRGYIEVIDDELSDKLTPELKEFMSKMSASAQTLTAFVSNILNVARVDDNQLNLTMQEANWNDLLPDICKNLDLRAKVRGKTIELDIAPNLPSVAVDKISIYEVVSNLVENAIKYSGDSSRIIIHASISSNGDVQTVVQDFGLGIPEAAVKHLFTKFYRSHRSKAQVGGTGLGLYLVKAMVSAHGGEVSVQSSEGKGSSFGFTLKSYASVAEDLKDPNGGIEHHAHGWIKNHSMIKQ